MNAKPKEFIVLAVGDKDSYGYDEHTLPLLVRLVDSSDPDARQFTHIGVVAYFLRSARAITAVEDIILRAESLRDTDERFATLGIGLAHGCMIANFDWLGRLKSGSSPLGEVANRAAAGVRKPQTYRETFNELHETNAA
jgi:hypothetical protein